MELGFVGLGRMGFNMVTRLVQGGHQVVATDRNQAVVQELAQQSGVTAAASLADLIEKLRPPRAVWVMVPSGGPTEAVIEELGGLLGAGDAVVDGGNSYFRDS